MSDSDDENYVSFGVALDPIDEGLLKYSRLRFKYYTLV